MYYTLVFIGVLLTSFQLVETFSRSRTLEEDWSSFKIEYSKSYSTNKGWDEEAYRKSIFAINKNQADHYRDTVLQTRGSVLFFNLLSDLSDTEISNVSGYRSRKPSYEHRNTPEGNRILRKILEEKFPVPEEFFWFSEPGCCSYSMVSNYRGFEDNTWSGSGVRFEPKDELRNKWFSESCDRGINCAYGREDIYSHLVDRSEDPLYRSLKPIFVDCEIKTRGCSEEFMKDIIEFTRDTISNHSSASMIDNPPQKFIGGSHTHPKALEVDHNDKDVIFLPTDDEESLKKVVARHGSVFVSIAGGLCWFPSFAIRDDGYVAWRNKMKPKHTLYGKDCVLLHELHLKTGLVVGYGTEPIHGDYWIVKILDDNRNESPRDSAGLYIKLARNRTNSGRCNIASHAYLKLLNSSRIVLRPEFREGPNNE